jgi:hypothetical protein
LLGRVPPRRVQHGGSPGSERSGGVGTLVRAHRPGHWGCGQQIGALVIGAEEYRTRYAAITAASAVRRHEQTARRMLVSWPASGGAGNVAGRRFRSINGMNCI